MVTRHRRLPAPRLLALVLVAASCGSSSVTAEDAPQLAVEAFRSAGLPATDPSPAERVEVDLAGGDDGAGGRRASVWLLSLDVEGEEWTVGIDPGGGAVVRTYEPEGARIDDEQVAALARFRADDGGSAGPVAVIVGGAMLAVVYLVLRHLARRDVRGERAAQTFSG